MDDKLVCNHCGKSDFERSHPCKYGCASNISVFYCRNCGEVLFNTHDKVKDRKDKKHK